MKGAYYNEFDPFAAAWLRNLIKANLIAPGEVDERSIREVQPEDLRGFDQIHLFAGIGGWSLALRLAGWGDDRPVWTGSCPCQPFSTAGAGGGFDDERHLWPEMHRLARELGPSTILGEQVASPDALQWLDLVFGDLEDEGYACAAADLCSASVGAPNIRQRIYWMGHADRQGRQGRQGERCHDGSELTTSERTGRQPRGLADSDGRRHDGRRPGQASDGRDEARVESERLCAPGGMSHAMPAGRTERRTESGDGQASGSGEFGGMGNPQGFGRQQRQEVDGIDRSGMEQGGSQQVQPSAPGQDASRMGDPDRRGPQSRHGGATTDRHGCSADAAGGSFWSELEWIHCRDGKLRPTKPGLLPLASGVPGRVGKLRAAGNAINPEVAAEFIRAVMEVIP